MGNAGNRGRNNGNYNRGGGGGGGGRGFYDQMSPPYYNQPQPYYHQQQQQARGNLHHMAGNYPPMNKNQRHPGSAGNRQRHNSNRSTNSRSQYDNADRPGRGPSRQSNDFDEIPVSSGE